MARNVAGSSRRPAIVFLALVEAAAVLLAVGIAGFAAGGDDPPGRPAAAPATATPVATPTVLPTQAIGTAPVIRPGRPGESAQVLRPDQLTPPPGAQHNAADIRFVSMMVPHHEQALAMAALVPERAGSTGVIAVADRIRAGQQPEVEVLKSWLRDRNLDSLLGGTGHEHATMHGMQSPEAIARLTATTGTDFDRMFVEMMSAHHQGAIAMAQEVLVNGVDRQIRELARNIAFEQAVEVNRMREVLDPQSK
ncbi:DUF305 domain-containing protein [Plantactinospora endophytica]|uniref:DUF305 domain-containing protein n=1 Tax=Plantactinospora endophytica TaxID=673535 RepID=UPI0019442A17|nr:DUF305 domain-containing protein [Plantactinospora endophytica]